MNSVLKNFVRLFDSGDLSEEMILSKEDGRHQSLGYNLEIANSVMQYDYNRRPRSIDLRLI